jgi:hypothetical protein
MEELIRKGFELLNGGSTADWVEMNVETDLKGDVKET